MLRVHKVPTDTIWRVFEWPGVLPYFNQAAQTGIGISWKSAVTAQMIGVVAYTIGEGVFTSKITLDSSTLVVWLIVVVVLGWACEKIVITIIKNLTKRWELKGVEIAERDPENEIVVDKDANLIISEITKIYNKKKVLDKFTMTIGAGERVALTGPTGSGKTTLIRIILGIESCNHGEVFVKDYEPRTYSAVFQESTLLPNLSVDENIMVIANKYSNDELVPGNLMPDELSGGMKRCAEIERALLAQSQIVILDEPFAGLDSATKTKAIKYIDDNLKGRSLILITHDKKDAKRLKCAISE
ncbi:MAG: ATP-binding cassette domain-containing protein [Coriobacteriia bacterium]|nr:ATP-binding cassette domain-containing protein [Coriobacteriia bacterium]